MPDPGTVENKVTLKRYTSSTITGASLAQISTLYDIPEQDLVGAAVVMLLNESPNAKAEWRKIATALKLKRTFHHVK